MCILYGFSITIIRDSPFFSLSSHGIRAKGKKNLNYFRFIRESILGNLSVIVFHSSHPSHLLKLFDQPYHRQKTLNWDAVRVSNERHNSLNSEMGMVILGSAEVDGWDEAGATGGALGMAGAVIVIPSGICHGDALLAAGCGRSG